MQQKIKSMLFYRCSYSLSEKTPIALIQEKHFKKALFSY